MHVEGLAVTYPIPDDEEQRVQQVEAYLDALDPPLGEPFTDMTGLASAVCDADAGTLSFVLSDRLRFEATVGMNLDDVPREEGFCTYALMEPDEIMVVEDAREDDRFKEWSFVRTDPGLRFYAGAPLLTSGGHVLGTICVHGASPQDLDAEQKEIMDRLRRIAANKIEVHRRTRQLQDAREDLEEVAEELERSNEDLANFAHVVSHEFKDPIMQVVGNLDLLEMTIEDALDEEAREHLEEVKAGMKRLTRLIEDMLAYAKVGRGLDDVEPVDMQALLEDVEKELEPQIVESDATVQLEELPPVEADAAMIRRVFKNLLSNALKYRDEEPPTVRISGEPEDGTARFIVEDNGIGIPEDDQDALFEPFQRGANAAGREGTGVGLALARRIVERHDGEMGVESTQGEGSTFWFTLPHATHAPSEDTPPGDPFTA